MLGTCSRFAGRIQSFQSGGFYPLYSYKTRCPLTCNELVRHGNHISPMRLRLRELNANQLLKRRRILLSLCRRRRLLRSVIDGWPSEHRPLIVSLTAFINEERGSPIQDAPSFDRMSWTSKTFCLPVLAAQSPSDSPLSRPSLSHYIYRHAHILSWPSCYRQAREDFPSLICCTAPDGAPPLCNFTTERKVIGEEE